eukprot:403345179
MLTNTKYSIRYQVYYFLPVAAQNCKNGTSTWPGNSSNFSNLALLDYTTLFTDKLKKTQLSLDKSKSLQYNMKKWVHRLKIQNTENQPHNCELIVQLWRISDDMNSIIHNKEFSQEELLFIGLEEQLEMFKEKLSAKEIQDILGDDGETEEKVSVEKSDQKQEKTLTKKQLEKLQKAQKIEEKKLLKSMQLQQNYQLNKESMQAHQEKTSEIAMNEDCFEDIISLRSEDSIIEVKPSKRQRKSSMSNDSVDENDFDELAFSQDNLASNQQTLDDPDGSKKFKEKQQRQRKSNIGQKQVIGTTAKQQQQQKIFMSTKIENEKPYDFSNFSRNLNELTDANIVQIQKYLAHNQILDFRLLVSQLNSEIFEIFKKFTISIDKVPDLRDDGQQEMILRCLRHHQQMSDKNAKESKGDANKQSNNNHSEDDDFFDAIKNIGQTCLCPLTLLFKTTVEGFWQLEKEATNLYIHDPLMHALQHETIMKKRQMKSIQSKKFDEFLNQKNNNELELFNKPDFEDEFNTDNLSNLQYVNSKLKKNGKNIVEYEDADQGSTKLSISPSTDQQVNETDQENNNNNYSILNDGFFNSPLKQEIQQIQQNVPQFQAQKQSVPQRPVRQLTIGTVQVAQNVLVNVMDSSQFLNQMVTETLPAANSNSMQQNKFDKLNNKKNIFQKRQIQLENSTFQEQQASIETKEIPSSNQILIHQDSSKSDQMRQINTPKPLNSDISWFVNEEDRYFKGQDYKTKYEDTHKLIKYLKTNYGKNDFYRYETDSKNECLVKTIVIITEQMKEKYLTYNDILIICPCYQSFQENRFNMLGLTFYGVNSNGRNIVFGFALVTINDPSSIEYAVKNFLFYMIQLPKVILTDRNHFKPKEFEKPRLLYCNHSILRDLSMKYDFLKQDEPQLYHLYLSLPMIENKEEFDEKITELQKIKFNQVENLCHYMQKLAKDKHLWSTAYRLPVNSSTRQKCRTADISLSQRNQSIEGYISNLIDRSIDFSPKEFFRQLICIEEFEFGYSNESKVINQSLSQKLELSNYYKDHILQNYTTYFQQRFKYQINKSGSYRCQQNNSQQGILGQESMTQQWNVGCQDKLSFKVSLQTKIKNQKRLSYLLCECGFSQISGIPCSHEYWVQNMFYSDFFENQNYLMISKRWHLNYEKAKQNELYEKDTGIMQLHKSINYTNSTSIELKPQVASKKKKSVQKKKKRSQTPESLSQCTQNDNLLQLKPVEHQYQTRHSERLEDMKIEQEYPSTQQMECVISVDKDMPIFTEES